MPELELTILLGIHHPLTVLGISSSCEALGYPVDSVSSTEEMLAKIKQREYKRYIMDLNLGHRNSPSIVPAIMIYDVVREQIESQRAKFLGIATNQQALAAAREIGIPAIDKLGLDILTLAKFFEGA